MPHALFTLKSHSDIEKFELEDSVVRGAARALLRTESTITRLLIDIRTERDAPLQVDTRSPGWDAALVISADDHHDAFPESMDELVVDAASVQGRWEVSIKEIRDIGKEWVGASTPGAKISFVLTRSAGIDAASFDQWLDDVANEIAAQMVDGGARCITLVDRELLDAPCDTIVSFWFPTDSALESATEERLFASVLSSHLVDEDSILVQQSVEHRNYPNPNAWEMPDGPLMPVPEPEPES